MTIQRIPMIIITPTSLTTTATTPTFEWFVQVVQVLANPVDVVLADPEVCGGGVLHGNDTVGLCQGRAAALTVLCTPQSAPMETREAVDGGRKGRRMREKKGGSRRKRREGKKQERREKNCKGNVSEKATKGRKKGRYCEEGM